MIGMQVVLGILFILFIIPIFDTKVGYYGNQPTFDENGLMMLQIMYEDQGNTTGFQEAVQVPQPLPHAGCACGLLTNTIAHWASRTRPLPPTVQLYINATSYALGSHPTSEIYSLVVCNETIYDDPIDKNRRESELIKYTVESTECSQGLWEECLVSEAGFDAKWHTRMQASRRRPWHLRHAALAPTLRLCPLAACRPATCRLAVSGLSSAVQAILNICRTSFIALLLVGGALLIIRDAELLVLKPVERMMKKVRVLSFFREPGPDERRGALSCGMCVNHPSCMLVRQAGRV